MPASDDYQKLLSGEITADEYFERRHGPTRRPLRRAAANAYPGIDIDRVEARAARLVESTANDSGAISRLRHPVLRLAAWLTWHSLEAKRHLYPLAPERIRRFLP